MSIALDGIELPPDLQWTDEFAWSRMAEDVTLSAGGAQWVELSSQLAGRPITLESVDGAWVDRAAVVAIQALMEAPAEMTLSLHGTDYTVIFRYKDGALSAKPVVPFQPPAAADRYTVTLKFRTV